MKKINLKGLNRKDLEKLRRDIDIALTKVEAVEKAALAAAEKAAREFGFSLAQLKDVTAAKPASAKAASAKPAKPDARKKVAPKYRNPADANATWTGRGRKPKWVEAHLESGGSLSDIEI
jgi:DNA-binding protein H-NS